MSTPGGPPVDWAKVFDRAHRRLAGRLMLVGTVAAAGSMLLLGGGLSGHAAVVSHREAVAREEEHREREDRVRRRRRACKGCHRHRRHGGNHEGKGGPGKSRAKPNLVVWLKGADVFVKDDSATGAGAFEVTLTTEREGEGGTPVSRATKSLGPHRVWRIESGCLPGGNLSVEVDSGKQIAESNEHDNVTEGECPSELPNLVPGFEKGQIVVFNESPVDAGAFDVRIAIEGSEGEAAKPRLLESGALVAEGTWESGVFCEEGDLVTVEVDTLERVKESNETDNTIDREKCPADGATHPGQTESPPAAGTRPSSEATTGSTEPIR